MSRLAIAVFRVVLLAYPASFRRDYREAMVQSLVDRHRHDELRQLPLVVGEIVDAARAAPLMRWESPMNRMVIVVIGATVAVAVAVAVGPWALIPLALLALVAGGWWWAQSRPIARTAPSRRALLLLAAGISGIAIAVVVPAVDGGELNGFWWTVMAVSLLVGIAMIIAAILVAIGDRAVGPKTASTR